MRCARLVLIVLLAGFCLKAQVYTPLVLKQGQVDSTNLANLARDVYTQAGARTPREKAEAIWRFFLTDGRFLNIL